MLDNYLYNIITQALPFEPTNQQQELIKQLSAFVTDPSAEKVFILKGYAGTGKTSIVSALVKSLHKLEQKTVLLAPTGRAAKVLSGYSGFSAFTIHKKIYRQKALGETSFQLADNLHTNTLFIVDEASMISNSGSDAEFGSGFLLDDLIQYIYNGVDCSLLLLGDTAQLPPVMQENSPALDEQNIAGYGLKISTFTLTHVVRQALESGILYNATLLRKALEDNLTSHMPKLKLSAFEDIKALSGMDLVDEVQRAYNGVGVEDTIVITRSNKRANIYNNGIRGRVMMREEEISNGDLLMVTRNNYFWNKPYKEIDFIANGDIVEVVRIRKHREMYGFRFVDLTLRSLDFNWEIDARVWLDILQSESPAHTVESNRKLFDLVAEDYSDVRNKREKFKLIFENEYMNALQVKFAYAVTCHKSQGGQWKNVFIDMGIMPDMEIDRNYYRWLYTAITRSTDKIFLVNYSSENDKK
ncbi:MAG: ATP-dependent endonuclease [Bacteroidales bacterium 36-12]|nr:MAG: ATP-dependent endonuclease [Bacteroidales bacterium 36-12]